MMYNEKFDNISNELLEIKLILKYMAILFLDKELHALGLWDDNKYRTELMSTSKKIAGV